MADEERAKGVPPPPYIDGQITVFPNFSQSKEEEEEVREEAEEQEEEEK